MAFLSALRDRKVKQTVVVKVSPGRAMTISGIRKSRGLNDVGKLSLADIPVEAGSYVIVIINKKIKITVPIEISPDWIAESISHGVEAGGHRGIGKIGRRHTPNEKRATGESKQGGKESLQERVTPGNNYRAFRSD
jgi:hypothetical protein